MESTETILSPAQRLVLETLKRRGEATAEELAEAIEISSSAIRQHLAALRTAGYVQIRQERGQLGRPAHVFCATEQSEAMFGRTGNELSVELLVHIEAEDPDLVTRVFERRTQTRVADMRAELDGKSLDEKVTLLVQLLDQEGYLADFEYVDPRHYRINLHSCALWAIASRYRQACGSELEFLRELFPEASVERVTHKTAGSHACVYEISA